MERLRVDVAHPAPEAIARAVEVLRAGGLVAFPTETVYGLCVDAARPARLFAAKGREASRACAYLLPDAAAADALTKGMPPLARRIAERLWPGPVTLVVPGPAGLIGLRLPEPLLPRTLAAAAGCALLQTSANRSGQPPALDGDGVAAALGDAVDLLLDGGPVAGGRASTVVKVAGGALTVLREGAVADRTLLLAATELTLLVCTGNLCRSPLAEALFRKVLAARFRCRPAEVLRFGHRFGSVGTMAMVGKPATEEAIRVGREHGVDLTPHRSRPFSLRALRQASRIFCLAAGHMDFLSPYLAERPGVLALLDPKGRDIPDPYGRPLKVYRRAAERIEQAVETRAEELPMG